MKFVGADIGTRGQVASAYGRIGDAARARAIIEELARNPSDARTDIALMRGYLGVGDTARALDAMERAVAAGRPFAISTPLADPLYDPVRASRRFAVVVGRLGLDGVRLTRPGPIQLEMPAPWRNTTVRLPGCRC